LIHTFSVGTLRCHTLEGGLQRLDGGAMFGVVPRPLWEKRAPPDARHRIPLGLRCLLIEHPDGPVLVDTGVGDKEDAVVSAPRRCSHVTFHWLVYGVSRSRS
jgi:hypothetical protein